MHSKQKGALGQLKTDIWKALRDYTQDAPPDNAEGDEIVQTTTELTPASES